MNDVWVFYLCNVLQFVIDLEFYYPNYLFIVLGSIIAAIILDIAII